MGGDNVLLHISLINQAHAKAGHIVPEADDGGGNALLLPHLVRGIIEFCVVRAVGVFHVKGRLADVAAAGDRIGGAAVSIIVFCAGVQGHILLGVGQPGSVVHRLQGAALMHQDNQRGMGRLDGQHLFLDFRNGYGFVGEFLGFTGFHGQKHQQQRGESEQETFHGLISFG